MGRFPIQYTERTVSGKGTSVRANINVDTGAGAIGQAIAGLGGTIADLGLKWDLMAAKTDLSNSNIAASNRINQYYTELDSNNDPTTYQQSFETLTSDLNKLAPKHPKAARVYNEALAERKIELSQDTIKFTKKKLVSNAQTADFMKRQIAIESGKEEDIQSYKASVIGNLKLGDIYSADDAQRLIEDIDRDVAFENEKKKIAAKEVLEQQREVDRDLLGSALVDGSINYGMINNTTLDEPEQELYRIKMNAETERKSKGKPIVTNQLIKGDIEAQAYKIWTGSISLDKYVKMLNTARYGEVVDGKLQYAFGDIAQDNPLIDDSAYDALRTLGTTELKVSQAKGLEESSYYAKGQLVKVASDEMFAFNIQDFTGPQKEVALSERQIQLSNWSQFNRSMRLWQSEHPDATEGDYYIESRRKLPFYRNRTDEEIQSGAMVKETNQGLNAKPTIDDIDAELRRRGAL